MMKMEHLGQIVKGLKPCPFCGVQLTYGRNQRGKEVMRHVDTDIDGCALAGAQWVNTPGNQDRWNNRVGMGWVRCKDRMPEATEDEAGRKRNYPHVLFLRKDGGMFVGYWTGTAVVHWGYGAYADNDVVTHWMPLPPEPGTDNER